MVDRITENRIVISTNAIVCEDTKLRGMITIGSNTIVHPRATIIAEAGPIEIGENCLIEEQARIIHKLPLTERANSDNKQIATLKIGNNNTFEVGCIIESSGVIGDNNVFETKSYVSPLVTVTSGIVVGAGCRLSSKQVIPENMIVYGEDCKHREALDKPQPQHAQLEFLAKVLPNYHHLIKNKSRKT